MQVTKTAEALRKYGVEVDIRLTTDDINYEQYNLLHFFNIIRPADILGHIKRSKKPYVVSPIFVDYSEFDAKVREGIVKYLYKFLSSHTVEYLKTIARLIKSKEQINSISYLIKGQKRSIEYILKYAKCLLPNSHSEYSRLKSSFPVEKPYVVVPNAIDPQKFILIPEENRSDLGRNRILCVARFEGLKNQLQLIKALNGWNIQVELVGKPSPNQQEYYAICRRLAQSNIHFINHLPQDKLPELYRRAKVHVLASWFETTGLSSLEAAAMGCNIVITNKGDQQEYFKDFAFYCDPGSAESVAEQVKLAYDSPVNPELRRHVLQHYTWEKAAEKTLEGYKLALSK